MGKERAKRGRGDMQAYNEYSPGGAAGAGNVPQRSPHLKNRTLLLLIIIIYYYYYTVT
jgi:hypothetical protein